MYACRTQRDLEEAHAVPPPEAGAACRICVCNHTCICMIECSEAVAQAGKGVNVRCTRGEDSSDESRVPIRRTRVYGCLALRLPGESECAVERLGLRRVKGLYVRSREDDVVGGLAGVVRSEEDVISGIRTRQTGSLSGRGPGLYLRGTVVCEASASSRASGYWSRPHWNLRSPDGWMHLRDARRTEPIAGRRRQLHVVALALEQR